LYEQLGFPYEQMANQGLRLFPSFIQANSYLTTLEAELARGLDYFRRHTQQSPVNNARYVALDTAHKFTSLLVSNLQIRTHHLLLADTCRKAGFATVDFKYQAAVEDAVVPNAEAIAKLDTSITNGISQQIYGQIRADGETSGGFFGGPFLFFEPKEQAYRAAGIYSLTAV